MVLIWVALSLISYYKYFFQKGFFDELILKIQTYPDLYPNPPTTVYIPRIYGFKIHKKKGSKYWEQTKNLNEITHYGEEQLKKLKALFSTNLHNNQGQGIIFLFLRTKIIILIIDEEGENNGNNPAQANVRE